MSYINLKPGQGVVVTIHGHVDEVTQAGVRVVFGSGYLLDVFTETDDVTVSIDELPEHWPPQPGDVWHLFPTPFEDGSCAPWQAWHALSSAVGREGAAAVEMVQVKDYSSDWQGPETLLTRGEMRLAYRDEESE